MGQIHLNNSQIAVLVNANSSVKEQLEKRWQNILSLFTAGTLIYWRTSGRRYQQAGHVIEVIGGRGTPRIRTSNLKTGRVVDVDFYSIDWDQMITQANFDLKEK